MVVGGVSGDESSDDLDLHSDDDLPDTLLPDDSVSPRSTNPAVLTPHFMAGKHCYNTH